GPLTLGSRDHPVIVAASGTVRLRGGVVLHGVVYGGSRVRWDDTGADLALVRGAVVSQGSVEGNGAPDIVYDGAVLAALKNNSGSIAENPGHKTVSVTAAWTDRTGKPQSVALESLIAGSDPLHAAALGVVQRAHAVKAVLGRSANVPLAAKDLGDGRSVLKPVSTGTLAFVFSNLTGQIIGRCNAVSPTVSTGSLSAADI